MNLESFFLISISGLRRKGFSFLRTHRARRGATIGGMIAENAGGPACVKYGVTKQYILGVEVVLPTAEIVNLGGRTLNASAGYDLMHLLIGSEGTLGFVTKAELTLRSIPPFSKTVMAAYDDAVAAGETVFRVFANGIIPTKIEYMDNWIINRIEEMMPMGLPKNADAILLFQSDGGTEEAVEKEALKIVETATKCGAREAKAAKNQAEADQYWTARAAGFAATFGKTRTVFAEDVTVPRPSIPALIKKCKEISKKHNVDIVVLGHAGDGNFHPAVLTDVSNREHYGRALRAVEEIIQSAVDLEGVISGEHGIGLEKQRFFDDVVDPAAVNMMKGIKRLFDPNDIMNPGKIWR
ncbi:MAG: FAD-linked oxidase C-terminal domain-containing protein [Syntrophorhabdales bacterium]